MNSDSTLVSAPAGKFTGLSDARGRRYLGIRFATAQRFESPRDLDDHDGVFDAQSPGAMCPQLPGVLETMAGYDPSQASEDCLFLNVFTPTDATAESELPVLVWIHGGAYLNGAGSLAWYDGSALAARGAVVVTINYRLGVLGFLGEKNLGTEDQISALRWVNRNIEFFGGNPRNVTIFGESAGGSAVLSLMSAPRARNLFHRVWAMSPSIGQLRTLNRAHEALNSYLAFAGASTVEELTHRNLDDLLAAQTKLLQQPSQGYDHFSPAAGGSELPDNMMDLISASPLPLVMGTTRDEDRLFSAFNSSLTSATQEDWIQHTRDVFGDNAPKAQELYDTHRGGEPWEKISAVRTDVVFRQRVRRLATQRSHNGSPTWVYWFTWQSTAFDGRFGAAHAMDIPFAFSTLDEHGVAAFTGEDPSRHDVADIFGAELVRFATHSHPVWAVYNAAEHPTFIIDRESLLVSNPEAEIHDLFASQ